jgi:hypothetical protein
VQRHQQKHTENKQDKKLSLKTAVYTAPVLEENINYLEKVFPNKSNYKYSENDFTNRIDTKQKDKNIPDNFIKKKIPFTVKSCMNVFFVN